MPKHKQAGHTTVLTKMRKQHNKTLAMQVPPTQDFWTICTGRLPNALSDWVSFHLAPVVDHMFKELKASSKLFADETRCPVLDPGRGKTKTGYLWAIARDERPFGGTAPPGVVICYADGRGGKHASAFLTGFSGTLQVDGYTGYNALTKPGRNSVPIKLAYCWAHARRKLKEFHDRDGSPRSRPV